MMRIEFKAGILQKALKFMGAITSECRLHISPSEIRAYIVDTRNVAIAGFEIDRDSFMGVDGEWEIGLDIHQVLTFLKFMEAMDSDVPIFLSKSDSEHLILGFEDHEFTVKSLDINTVRKEPNPPKIKLPVTFTLSGSWLSATIRAASCASDKVDFRIADWSLTVIASGEGTEYRRTITPERISAPRDGAASRFSLDYMKDMVKCLVGESVKVSMGEDHPIRFEIVPEGFTTMEYLLAPRMRDEEKKEP